MKTVSRVSAVNAGNYGSSAIKVTIEMTHKGLTRDEVSRVKHEFEDGVVELARRYTNHRNIKLK